MSLERKSRPPSSPRVNRTASSKVIFTEFARQHVGSYLSNQELIDFSNIIREQDVTGEVLPQNAVITISNMQDLNKLSKVTEMQGLIVKFPLNKKSLHSISKFSELTYLSLEGGAEEDTLGKYLFRLKQLNELSIANTTISFGSIFWDMPSLTVLRLHNCKMSTLFLNSTINLINLKKLKLTNNVIALVDQAESGEYRVDLKVIDTYSFVENVPNLEKLTIQYGTFPASQGDIMSISKATNLTSLNISGIDDAKMFLISSLSKLNKLTLVRSSITAVGMRYLLSLPLLQKLDLSYCHNLNNECVEYISKNKTLIKLYLRNTKITDITPLIELPYLSKLDISYCKDIPEENMFRLSDIRSLTSLDVSYTNASYHALRYIADLGILHTLKITLSKEEKGDNINVLARHPTLEKLTLYQSNLSNGELRVIGTIANLKSLIMLDSLNNYNDRGLSELSKLSLLRELYLSNNSNITEKGLKSLTKLEHLTTLTLDKCRGFTNNILYVLLSFPSLQHLSLQYLLIDQSIVDELRILKPYITVEFETSLYNVYHV